MMCNVIIFRHFRPEKVTMVPFPLIRNCRGCWEIPIFKEANISILSSIRRIINMIKGAKKGEKNG